MSMSILIFLIVMDRPKKLAMMELHSSDGATMMASCGCRPIMNNPPDGDAIPRSYSLSSKSPDLAGDLPIFDIVMTIS